MKRIILFLMMMLLTSCGKSFTVECYYKGKLMKNYRTTFATFSSGDAYDKCILTNERE